VAGGVLATTLVGVSVPVTGLLAHYPVLSGQAIRYGIGALALYAWLRRSGRRVPMPGWRDLLGLAGMVGPGMLGFNAAVLAAQRYAEPGFVAAMLGGPRCCWRCSCRCCSAAVRPPPSSSERPLWFSAWRSCPVAARGTAPAWCCPCSCCSAR